MLQQPRPSREAADMPCVLHGDNELFECQVLPSGNAAGYYYYYAAWGPKGCRRTLLRGDSMVDACLNLFLAV